MKKALVRFLLGRGTGKLGVVLSKLVRHGLSAVGGASVFSGMLTDSDMATLQGAGAIVVSVALSAAREVLAPRVSAYLAN